MMMNIGWALWCFSEQRMFGAYNIYKYFLPNINTNQLALKILNRLPIKEREKVIKESGQELERDKLPFQRWLQEFKEHSIKYNDLLDKIIISIESEDDI